MKILLVSLLLICSSSAMGSYHMLEINCYYDYHKIFRIKTLWQKATLNYHSAMFWKRVHQRNRETGAGQLIQSPWFNNSIPFGKDLKSEVVFIYTGGMPGVYNLWAEAYMTTTIKIGGMAGGATIALRWPDPNNINCGSGGIIDF